jgi:cytosine/adenosine deaminase-related metal-dependent hydrolase
MSAQRSLYRAAMVVDADSVRAAPGALLIEDDRIVASGTPQQIGEAAGAAVREHPDAVIIPALVNAHCHLDLTHIGPLPLGGAFDSWADRIRSQRATEDEAIAASVRRGVELSIAGGTALVGDIAGAESLVPFHELRRSSLRGVSFLEVFGHGRRQQRAIERIVEAVAVQPEEADGVRFGLQPHAPYSCGPDVYRAAAALRRPLATHLAETLEELRFVADADGPLADLLRRLGVWDDSITAVGLHPIDALAETLASIPVLAAHVNYPEPHHLEMLRDWSTTVAYCPRASAYFGHPADDHPPHAYREMLDSGVNVALGTDSIICLDTPDRLSVLDEMRLLHQRDGTDPHRLLAMATINGARALGFEPERFTFRAGPTAGFLAIAIDEDRDEDPLRRALETDRWPEWLLPPVHPA